MGGGDKLYEKIDNGIRAAKVVCSLVTEKYAKSANCNKEVSKANVNHRSSYIFLAIRLMYKQFILMADLCENQQTNRVVPSLLVLLSQLDTVIYNCGHCEGSKTVVWFLDYDVVEVF